eukprot:464440_1
MSIALALVVIFHIVAGGPHSKGSNVLGSRQKAVVPHHAPRLVYEKGFNSGYAAAWHEIEDVLSAQDYDEYDDEYDYEFMDIPDLGDGNTNIVWGSDRSVEKRRFATWYVEVKGSPKEYAKKFGGNFHVTCYWNYERGHDCHATFQIGPKGNVCSIYYGCKDGKFVIGQQNDECAEKRHDSARAKLRQISIALTHVFVSFKKEFKTSRGLSCKK